MNSFSLSAWLLSASALTLSAGELLKNGGFESLDDWNCGGFTCSITESGKRSGQYGVMVSGRSKVWMGPSQFLNVLCSKPSYQVSGYMRLLSDQGPQTLQLTTDFKFADSSHQYTKVDVRNNVESSAGWVHLTGSFSMPTAPLSSVRVYFGGPSAGVEFAVDDASVIAETCQCNVPLTSDQVIEKIRKSDINVNVTTTGAINKNDIKILIRQLKKSFPFGTAVNVDKYNENVAGSKYWDIIHRYFNWVILKNALKWPAIEWKRDYGICATGETPGHKPGQRVKENLLLPMQQAHPFHDTGSDEICSSSECSL